jgi:putative ABC transport system permease protein
MRSVFWRLCLRPLQSKRPEPLLAIGSLVVGAAVCSLLLSLYGGVKQKMTASFSSFGPNLILAPRAASRSSSSLPSVRPQPSSERLAELAKRFPGLASVPVLYAVVQLDASESHPQAERGENVVAVGADLADLWRMYPGWRLKAVDGPLGPAGCVVGERLSENMDLRPGDDLTLQTQGSGAVGRANLSATYRIQAMVSTGGAQDDQVFVPLNSLQRLTGMQDEVSTVELRFPGDAQQIERAITPIAALFPRVDVRPVRQIVYSEGRVLGTISRLMLALTALILVTIALCVTATMTSIVIERSKDIALMKALGASDRVVMQFLLSEGAALGLIGGVLGFGIGAVLARDVALRLFHVALGPSAWVFALVCFSSILLAVIATLFPAQIVRRIQPAVALKGA